MVPGWSSGLTASRLGPSPAPDERQGYARAAVAALLDQARREPTVKIVRASVRPDNQPSWRVLEPYGFEAVGEQWDDEDGTELIVELSLKGQST